MDTGEVVEHEVQRDRASVIVELLAERISQAGEPSDSHSHGKVCTLYVAR